MTNQQIAANDLPNIESVDLMPIPKAYLNIIFLNAFVLWCMLYWLISHRFFKKAKRTSRETVFVFMYGLGMIIFFVYVPFIAISGATDENALVISFLVVLLLFLINLLHN